MTSTMTIPLDADGRTPANRRRTPRMSRLLTVLRFIGRKLLYALVIVLGVSIIVQGLFSLVPGGPATAMLGMDASQEDIERLNDELGMNDPVWERYLTWMSGVVVGDFGESFRTGRPVTEMIFERLPVTLELAVLATIVAVFLGVILAVLCVLRPGRFLDRFITGTASAIISVPNFLIGLGLVYVFAIQLGILPILGWRDLEDGLLDHLRFLILPVLMLAAHEMAEYARVLRGDLLTTLSEEFITVARSTGLPTRTIMFRYALRPSTLTILTLAGLNFGRLLGGTVVAEAIFSLSGLGSLLIQAINNRDLPLVQGIVLFVAIAFVVVNIVVDVLYSVVDPRVRLKANK